MGHVNHAVYFTYFEQCRFAWWRHLGSASGMPGATTVIVHADCDYRAPAHVHDELEIQLSVGKVGRTSVTLMYDVLNVGNGEPLASGRTVNVAIDPSSQRPIAVPDSTRRLLERPFD